MNKPKYTGPDICPICDCAMHSWLHLQEHAEELYQRAINPDDRAILKLKEYGCAVNRHKQMITVEVRSRESLLQRQGD